MMFHIKDDFKAGQPVSAVPASWFNRVAGFLNNLIGTKGVTLTKEGEPPLVTIDTEWLDSYLGGGDTTATPSAIGGDAPYPTGVVTQEADTLWDRSTATAGAAVRVAFKCEFAAGVYSIYAARLVFDKSGRLSKIETAKNEGWSV